MSAIPDRWIAYVFGSSSACLGDSSNSCGHDCPQGDVDILIVYPRCEWRRALEVRYSLWWDLKEKEILADVVLLNHEEEAESRFAESESAVQLVPKLH